MKNNLFMLSLCMKAGKLITGEQAVEKAVRSGGVYLLIVPGDASENTKNKIINKGKYYNIPVLIVSDRESLSRAVGKVNRTSFAITDKGFADKIYKDISPSE